MSTMEERIAAITEGLREKLDDQQRQAKHEDFRYDATQDLFWDITRGTLHSADSVNAMIPIERWRVEVTEGDAPVPPGAPRPSGRPRQPRERLIKPSIDIMRVENGFLVNTSTWAPGHPKIIKDMDINDGGLSPSQGIRIYNNYRPSPKWENGDPTLAWPWEDAVKTLFPDPVEHNTFFNFFAHLLQKPAEKCNFAIVLSGTQGIGKDMIMLPVKAAVGEWNYRCIDPDALFSKNRTFLQTLLLVVDEVRPAQDEHRAISFYNLLKPLSANPPNTLPVEEKYQKMIFIPNVLRLILTTNDYMSLYIPPEEDRRLFVMHSTVAQDWYIQAGKPDYFERLADWYEKGGFAHVAAWLMTRDISTFKPKGRLIKTAAHEAIASTCDVSDDAIGMTLDALKDPDIVFGLELLAGQFDGRDEVAAMLKSPRKIGHRMQRSGYTPVRPMEPGADKWTFVKGAKRIQARVVFVKQTLMNSPDLLKRINEHGMKLVTDQAAGNVFSLKKDDF